jgi:MoaA/NifB/PqqE/SkfB family radical SAM enzyme
MNKYVNLKRIEFSITDACTGRCRHCSAGCGISASGAFAGDDHGKADAFAYDDHGKADAFADEGRGRPYAFIDEGKAVKMVSDLAGIHSIASVMTFGGEPLLRADTVCAIHKAAAECGIPKRQVITNGYFTKNLHRMGDVAKALKESGVNSLLLSVDAFHKEHIPMEQVHVFARMLSELKIDGFCLHPAWVVTRGHENPFNRETEECLRYFSDLDIPVSSGNDIFPVGNAATYLADYYPKKAFDLSVKCGEAPYTTKLDNVETISVNPNGDVMVCCFAMGNINHESIAEILERYDPYGNPIMKALLAGGAGGLIDLALENGIKVDASQYYSACGICSDIVSKLVPA